MNDIQARECIKTPKVMTSVRSSVRSNSDPEIFYRNIQYACREMTFDESIAGLDSTMLETQVDKTGEFVEHAGTIPEEIFSSARSVIGTLEYIFPAIVAGVVGFVAMRVYQKFLLQREDFKYEKSLTIV